MFQKGVSGNPKGRKPGSKDHKWATLQYWFDQLNKDLQDPKLHVSDRVKAQLKLIELILAKKSLPQDVDSSVKSVNDTLKMLKDIEQHEQTDDTGTDKVRLDNRSPKI